MEFPKLEYSPNNWSSYERDPQKGPPPFLKTPKCESDQVSVEDLSCDGALHRAVDAVSAFGGPG